jgi:uncharacterized damage-inducible protein DinB
MKAVEVILSELEENRRRSILIWKAIPEEFLNWKVDERSISLIETVRHVIDCDEWYRQTIIQQDSTTLDYDAIFGERSLTSVQEELKHNEDRRKAFLELVSSLSDEDLNSIIIKRMHGPKKLRIFLSEIPYHEAYHAGQINLSLKMLNVSCPDIWD